MLKDNAVFQKELEELLRDEHIPWEAFRGKRVYITGATGLIGYTLTSALLQFGLRGGQVEVIALVRSKRKAEKTFSDWLAGGARLVFQEGAMEDRHEIPGPVDYAVHCAAPTASAYFVDHPVETIDAIYTGTKHVLELAREKCAQGIVFLSSMEAYGQIAARKKLGEADLGYIDLFSPRSSYPEGKRLAEALCCAYAAQYGVPATVARLAQTFGPGVKRDDGRVFAYMARCALAGEDIRLNTDGTKESMYLYTMDAVSAVLLLLVKGERGGAYNVANESTYCSIKEMGELVSKTLGQSGVRVVVNSGHGDVGKYRPAGCLNLDASKLQKLGWKAKTGLSDMYRRTFAESSKLWQWGIIGNEHAGK